MAERIYLSEDARVMVIVQDDGAYLTLREKGYWPSPAGQAITINTENAKEVFGTAKTFIKKSSNERLGFCSCGRPSGHRGIHRGTRYHRKPGKIEEETNIGGDDGPLAAMGEPLEDKIRAFRLQNPDKTSVDCARMLKIMLKQVNKHW